MNFFIFFSQFGGFNFATYGMRKKGGVIPQKY